MNFLHFIRIVWYFYWLIWSEFPKIEISINCVAFGQWLSKCGYMTVFGADFIEIFTD